MWLASTLYFLMKEMGMSYQDALEVPAGLVYQLQHAHCRTLDKTCYFSERNEDKVNDMKERFEQESIEQIDEFDEFE